MPKKSIALLGSIWRTIPWNWSSVISTAIARWTVSGSWKKMFRRRFYGRSLNRVAGVSEVASS